MVIHSQIFEYLHDEESKGRTKKPSGEYSLGIESVIPKSFHQMAYVLHMNYLLRPIIILFNETNTNLCIVDYSLGD